MGGNNTCPDMYYMYPKPPPFEGMELFYGIQFGSHLYDLVWQILFVDRKEKKYYEFLLHHLMAWLLIFFSFSLNFTSVGVIVLLLHDSSDIFLILGRWVLDLKWKSNVVIAIVYVLTLIVWFYTRIVLMSGCMMKSTYYFMSSLDTDTEYGSLLFGPMLFMSIMCTLLIVMNMIWWIFILLAANIFGGKKEKKRKIHYEGIEEVKKE